MILHAVSTFTSPRSPSGIESCVSSSIVGYSPYIRVSNCISSRLHSKVSGHPSVCFNIHRRRSGLVFKSSTEFILPVSTLLSCNNISSKCSCKLLAFRSQNGLGISLIFLFISSSDNSLVKRILFRSRFPTNNCTRSG